MTSTSGPATTTQLRRYDMVEGSFAEFQAWWTTTLVPVREAAGFTVGWASVSDDESEFVWTVSAPGSRDEFLALEAVYLASDARARAFAGQPKRVAEMHLSFVTPVDAAPVGTAAQ
jgi:hypothetical protein